MYELVQVAHTFYVLFRNNQIISSFSSTFLSWCFFFVVKQLFLARTRIIQCLDNDMNEMELTRSGKFYKNFGRNMFEARSDKLCGCKSETQIVHLPRKWFTVNDNTDLCVVFVGFLNCHSLQFVVKIRCYFGILRLMGAKIIKFFGVFLEKKRSLE